MSEEAGTALSMEDPGGCRGGSVAKSTGCSCRGPRLGSQHLRNDSATWNSSLGDSTLSCEHSRH